jgi:FG-GAP-like repeat
MSQTHWRKSCACIGLCLLPFFWKTLSSESNDAKVWTTDRFLDFVEGELVDGGANSYVAADGSIRLINLYDLNQDGNVDAVFPSTHDNSEAIDLYIYWGKNGLNPSLRTLLPTAGAKDVAIADLNRDGYPDLVVANRFDGTRTDLNSYIYWGSAQGLNAENRTELPTQGAESIAVGDLNQDGFPEIVFANSGLSYHVAEDTFNQSFVYWGSPKGYSADRRLNLKTINGRDVKIADLNRDGAPDLAFANEGNSAKDGGITIYWGTLQGKFSAGHSQQLPGEFSSGLDVADFNGDGHLDMVLANAFRLKGRELGIYDIIETVAIPSFVYWGSAQGYSSDRRSELPTVGARSVAAGDLDQDGLADLAFANGSGGASYVYWASQSGFKANRRLALPTLAASRSAVFDLNSDGKLDLIFANRSGAGSHETVSYVYWGDSRGLSPERRLELPTQGAAGIAVGDLDRDGKTDLVFANKEDGTAGSPTDTYIYWGDARGQFDPSRRQSLPTRGPNAYAAADLNADGFPDLYMPESESTIYWGSQQGYAPVRKSVVGAKQAMSGQAADFNRDGYLDLALSEWAPGEEGAGLYWGGPAGYSAANRFVFRIGSVRFHAIADLNRDGWPDVIFPTTSGEVVIFWNSANGFDNARKQSLPCAAAVSTEVADLNGDGYLEVIVANLWDKNPPPGKPRSFGGSPEADTFIYWGSASGYSATRRQVLPSVGNEDVTVADLNQDGKLDLVLTSYHAGSTRNAPSRIYWNGAQGFDPSRVMLLPTHSASGAMVADFNRDGWKDILITCHSYEGNHRNDSFLYWGSSKGYSVDRKSLLHGLGPHLMNVADIGNIYNRSDRYDYISPPFRAGAEARWQSLRWKAETPFRTRVEFQIRRASSAESLTSAPWQGPAGEGTFFQTSGAALEGLKGSGDWIQYKATLVSPDSANSPVVRSVSLEYR